MVDISTTGMNRLRKDEDGDHTDGHYITLFTEQLTRTFEVLVGSGMSSRSHNVLSCVVRKASSNLHYIYIISIFHLVNTPKLFILMYLHS